MKKTTTKKTKVVAPDEYFREIFQATTPADIIDVKGLSEEDRKEIRGQANALLASPLLGRIMKEMIHNAQVRMFADSQNWEQVIFPKACLYMMDVLERKIKTLSKM